MFNKEIKKDYLISDLKDAFISSSILGGFGILVSTSSKAFGLLWQTNSSLIKRFGINGLVGAIYAGMRGLFKPEKEDKFSVKNIAQGFVEGIFLGEGARFMSKIPASNLLKNLPDAVHKSINYLQVFTGAALGSIAFKMSNYALSNKVELSEIKDTKALFEHLFKGNSYPTLIM